MQQLTSSEQHTLFVRLQNYISSDRQPIPQFLTNYNQIRNEIMLNNLGWVRKIAYGYYKRATSKTLSEDELYSAGIVGLMEAIRKYDPYRGFAFTTFSISDIRQAIQLECLRNSIIKIPKRIKLLSMKHSRYMAENHCSLDETFTTLKTKKADRERIACCLLHSVEKYKYAATSETSGPDVEYKDRGHQYYLDTEDNIETLAQNMCHLDSRSRRVIELRFAGETLDSVGKHLLVTKARAQQIEKTAIDKLRRMCLAA